MLERDLAALTRIELIELLTRELRKRDEVNQWNRSGLRVAEFTVDKGEAVIVHLVGVADWSHVQADEAAVYREHFNEMLVQSGTCEVCQAEIVSYSKTAICPACGATVGCT